MDHLVVGQRQNIVLRESVHEGEGDVPVVELPEVGVQLDVVADVVHPAHVPLEVEAQAAVVHRVGHLGPGGGLLGDHQHVRVGGEDGGVQLLEELDGLQVLLAAVDVGHPGPVLTAVVQIEHGGHRVYPQAIGVVLLQPEHGVGKQEGAHLVPAQIKDLGAPVGVLPLPGVGVLIGGGAVEVVQAEGVPGEVGGDPVQNHAHARLVQLVDQVFEIVGGAEAAGGGKIAGDLVAPGGVQGVLHHGQQLHVGVAHLLHIGDQVVGGVPVGEKLPLAGAPPGAQMALIDVHGPAVRGILGPVLQPVLVPPGVLVQLIDLGGVARTGLCMEGVGIGLGHHLAVGALDGILIGIIALQAGNKSLPDPALHLFQGSGGLIPSVEVSEDAHLFGIGRPHPEGAATLPVHLIGVGPKTPPCVAAAPLREGFQL